MSKSFNVAKEKNLCRTTFVANKNWSFVLIVFFSWFLILFLISYLFKADPSKKLFIYFETTPKNPEILWNRANFDGVHYLSISRNGYGTYQQAFFPLYPFLIKKITPIFGGKDLLAAFLFSNFCFLLALTFFFKLVCLDYPKEVAKNSLLFLIFFPTSFFFGSVYTESLFLLLILSSFYFARKGNFLISGLLGAFASATRIVGIFLFLALFFEWFEQNKTKKSSRIAKISNLIFLFFVPVGLLWYMYFLKVHYHDPLAFFHVQPFFGAQRSGDKIILLYQVFWRYLKMIFTTKKDILYFTVWQELFTAISFIFLLIISYKNKIRLSYLVFSVCAFLSPTITGTFSSLPRYVLILFPCFILLGTIKNKLLRNLLLLFFGVLFLFNASLFFRGFWVA